VTTPISEEAVGNTSWAPVPDLPSNPFSPANQDLATRLQDDGSAPERQDAASSSGEEFPDPSPTTSPCRSPPPAPTQARGSPRAGPHSTSNRSSSRSSSSNSRSPPGDSQQGAKKKRVGAPDVRNFFKTESGRQYCEFCRHQHSIDSSYEAFGFSADTGMSTLRNHLLLNHLEVWVEACDKFKITITAAAAQQCIAQYRQSKGQPTAQSTPSSDRPADIPNFSRETFVDAVTEFIIADDQSLNVVESPHLRRIFMLLKSDLKDSDIPHRTAIRNHVKEVYDEYLMQLESDIKVRFSLLVRNCLTCENRKLSGRCPSRQISGPTLIYRHLWPSQLTG
ncbi:LOW QUALITY PROTEIN: hypothetical protein CVT26_009163, partial [Gymnopilus dilepis]